jgi:hypothetical protein
MKNKLLLSIACLMCVSSALSAKEFPSYSLTKAKHSFVIKSLKDAADDENGIKGKIMISADVGLNTIGKNIELRYYGSSYYYYDGNISNSQASPFYNLGVDYGLGKKVSVGVAFGFQTARITFDQNVSGNGVVAYDSWRRIHASVRGDYYIIAKEKISLYTGLKLGLNLYTVSTTLPSYNYPNYIENMGVTPQPLCVQAHFGFSYYFNGMIGINTEIGLGVGTPYLFAVGLAIKL